MVPKLKRELPNVLVVCHGNICRSPLAGVVIAAGLGSDRVRDRGLSGRLGQLAAKKVRDYAASKGYDLSSHRSTPVTEDDLGWATVVLYMDSGNLRRLQATGVAAEKLECLAAYVYAAHVPDPNYLARGTEELRRALDMVVTAATRFVGVYRVN